MDEKMRRMMEQLQKDPSAIQGLMQSRDGQALLRMLTQHADRVVRIWYGLPQVLK